MTDFDSKLKEKLTIDMKRLENTRKTEARLSKDPHNINPVAPYQSVPFSGPITRYRAKSIPVVEPDSSVTEKVRACLQKPVEKMAEESTRQLSMPNQPGGWIVFGFWYGRRGWTRSIRWLLSLRRSSQVEQRATWGIHTIWISSSGLCRGWTTTALTTWEILLSRAIMESIPGSLRWDCLWMQGLADCDFIRPRNDLWEFYHKRWSWLATLGSGLRTTAMYLNIIGQKEDSCLAWWFKDKTVLSRLHNTHVVCLHAIELNSIPWFYSITVTLG